VASQTSTSLDQPLGDQEDALFGDLVAGDGRLPEEEVEETLRNEALAEALACLGKRKRDVIVLRYGLYGSGPETLAQIGLRLGCRASACVSSKNRPSSSSPACARWGRWPASPTSPLLCRF
jgi:DNA-directed RNA polymerase sigma subunit (sigma70/sigma32)